MASPYLKLQALVLHTRSKKVSIVCWHIWEVRNEVRNSDAKACSTTAVKKVVAYVEMIVIPCLKPSCLIWFVLMLVQQSLPLLRVWLLRWRFEIIWVHVYWLIMSRNGISSSEIAEALALRCVVVLALEESFHSMVLQSDCLALILRINAPVTAVRYRTTAGFK